ncbi:transcriptional regulator [Pseudomonas japonica]|uniref:transcriptional regulator n=1 Tax=Pseudomonas japonica TaxID=256466 RepID=UPI0015E41A81|nr:transcriptional regulator [Pseudomonas japonica]MBA1288849.1 transcriptional regulator [Pseudomonas japonica]
MPTYNWDLIERLLHKVQSTAGETFDSNHSAEELAQTQAAEGATPVGVDTLKADASSYETLLRERGFIEAGAGQGYQLTTNGARLLALLDSSIPDSEHPRDVLDEQEDALDPLTFVELANKAQVAP